MEYKAGMNAYRNLVVGVDTKVPLRDGRLVTAINFDNAATTPPFVYVMREIVNFAPWYSSVHRGTGYKSKVSSDMYEKSRFSVLKFINADPRYYTVIYVKNATEAINKLSNRLCDYSRKCIILSTCMEHHSNDLPWRNKYNVDYIDVDCKGALCMDDMEYKLKKYNGDVKLVTIAGASNVTGYVNPIHEAATLAHRYNAKICVDGAQMVPHMPVNMNPGNGEEYIDYLVFSAHKMYAPFGIGVLIGPREDFQNGEPDYSGGGTVKIVTHSTVKWDIPPHKEEAGSPNIMGVAALMASIKTLNMIGMKNIEDYEKYLVEYTLYRLNAISGIKLYGNTTDSDGRVGIIPFNISGINHDITARVLSDEAGIAVRNGCFCAQPYIQRLLNVDEREIERFLKNPDFPRPGMVRISFGLYNDCREIDILADTLKAICGNREYYRKEYIKSI